MSDKGKILVTGGLGYIGSHTCVELLESGYEVIIVDNLSNSRYEVLESIGKISGNPPEFYLIDLRESKTLEKFIRDKSPIKGVIHFAAFKSVPESEKVPLDYYDNNICGLINLLNSIKNETSNLIYSSSCSVYGEPNEFPVSEEHPISRAESVYGDTKIKGEEILGRIKSLNTISLRYFNPVGAHESLEIGENPIGDPDSLVPKMNKFAKEDRELIINGSDWQTPDGTCIRDYIHVVDLAKAHVKALDFILNKKGTGFVPMNIGRGDGISVKEMVDYFNLFSPKKLKYSFGERREGDIGKIWANTEKSKFILGFEPKLGIREMMESSIDWYNKIRKDMV